MPSSTPVRCASGARSPDALLAAAGITGTLRAEDLSVKDFARLALVFERARIARA
jgi:hypothetical protein